jgi:hypothetical protein
VALLDEAERSLLEVVAVFVDGWTVEAAASVAGMDADRVLDLSEALERNSLIQVDSTGSDPRCRMLETVRQLVSERLATRPDAGELQQRHARYYRALAEQADQPLRGLGQKEWLDRLDAEAANLAAAVRWYLGNDPAPLPHLFRVLWPFFSLRDRMSETRPWLAQLVDAADAFGPVAQSELAWCAAGYASDTGDCATAQAARQRLGPLLDAIEDPFLRALSHLVMAWTAPLDDDFDAAVEKASLSLQQLRAQDESFWTVVAGFTAGTLEIQVGRHDDARKHLCEARDRAAAFDGTALRSGSLLQLGKLEILHGHHDQARVLLDEALSLSLDSRSTPFVTMSLAMYARMAFSEGDFDRAATLEGASEGLRQRVGLRPWPMLLRSKAELAALVREALGADRSKEVTTAGARLSQRQAVAIVREANDRQSV